MTPDWSEKPVTVPYANFGDPQTLNLYAFVENAPVNRVDAEGHDSIQPEQLNYGAMGCGAADGTPCQSNQSNTEGATQAAQAKTQQTEASAEQATQTNDPNKAQNTADAQKPPQPAPTDPNGKPTPPPVPVPGAPEGTGWKWNPDPQNPRGGTWGPDGWKGPNPPRGSWDPNGHWDIDKGDKSPRDHYDPKGNPITPGQAHPGNAPSQFSLSPPGRQAAQTAVKVGVVGTVGAAIIYALGVAFGEIN